MTNNDWHSALEEYKMEKFKNNLLKELGIAMQDKRLRIAQKTKRNKLSTFTVHARERAKERFPQFKLWDLYKDFAQYLYGETYAIPNCKYVVIGEKADYVISESGRILTVDNFKYSKVELSKTKRKEIKRNHTKLYFQ